MDCGFIDYAKLSNEEIVGLINKGDNSSLHELFHRFSTSIQIKAAKFSSSTDFDDFVQEGLIALFSATKVYNSSLSSFSTFADVCIERAMCSLYRKNFAKKQIPGENIISIDEFDFLSANTTPESYLIEKEECNQLTKQIKSSLSKLEYNILLAFLSGDSLEQVAKRFSISLKTVNNAMFRARNKIKTLY